MNREVTNQELLDRYIHSVQLLLPPETRGVILPRKSGRTFYRSLTNRAIQLGRGLSAAELNAILKQHGHPMLVAGRYRDQPRWSLISPELFPFYRFALFGIPALVLTIRVVAAAFAFHGNAHPGSILLQLCSDIFQTGFFIAGWVTFLFAALEYSGVTFRLSGRWKPESLPAVPRLRQPLPLVQLIGGVAWLMWFAVMLYAPRLVFWGEAGAFSLWPAWYAARLPLWLLAFIGMSQSGLSLTRFASAGWLPFARIGVNLAGLALIVFVLRAGDPLVPGTNGDPSRYGDSLTILNRIVSGSLLLAILLSVITVMTELREYVRSRRNRHVTAI